MSAEAALPLDEALSSYVAALAHRSADDARVSVLLSRLGLAGQPPVTARQAGDTLGVSGERIRQLVAALNRRRDSGCPFPYLPQLDLALSAVAQALPLESDDVPRILVEAGVLAQSFCLESLLAAATFLNRCLPFEIDRSSGRPVLVPLGRSGTFKADATAAAHARRRIRQSGAASLADLAAELRRKGVLSTRRQLRLTLEWRDEFLIESGHWIRFRRDDTQSSFVQTSLRMLAVSSPLPVDALRAGLARGCKSGRSPIPAPTPVLEGVYRDSPWFSVDVHGSVSPRDPSMQPQPPNLTGLRLTSR